MAIDIEAAARYPMESDDWTTTVLIGGLLALFSFLLVPLVLLYGYLVRVIRAGIDDDPEPPTFGDWGDLAVEGLVSFLIILVYQLLPIVVFAVTVGGSVLAFASGSDAGVGLGLAGLLGGLSLTLVLTLVFGYVGIIGVANYAHEGSFGDGFDLDVIRDVALDGAYAVPFVAGVGFLFVAGAVASFVASIPLLGVLGILGAFLTFYAQIAAGRLWGRGFADARGLDAVGTDDRFDADTVSA
jgi:hypothetical protein